MAALLRTLAPWLALGLVLGGVAASAMRVLALERAELAHESQARNLIELATLPGATRVSARLTSVELQAGEHALFELCSEDRLEPARWLNALELVVLRLPQTELMLRVPLDAAHLQAARRDGVRACLPLGGGRIERAGRYSLDLVWPARPPPPEVRGVKLQARVLARRPLSEIDRAAVIALGLGVLIALAALWGRRSAAASGLDALGAGTRGGLQSLLLAAAAIAALVLLTRVPSNGSTATLLKGLALVALQAGAALVLARRLRPGASLSLLGFAPPPRTVYWLGAALIATAALVIGARLALRLVPATGEAPVQTFVSWPSGMLCFAALGALLPLGEELFFRGYLYRIALGLGRAAAFWLTVALFVALHAEQSWGNWGGLVSIALAGLVLTGLRARSGSVLVPALAHVLYNFTLSMASF